MHWIHTNVLNEAWNESKSWNGRWNSASCAKTNPPTTCLPLCHLNPNLPKRCRTVDGTRAHIHVLNFLIYIISRFFPLSPRYICLFTAVQVSRVKIRSSCFPAAGPTRQKFPKLYLYIDTLFNILDHTRIAFFSYGHTLHFCGFRASKLCRWMCVND